MSVVSRGSTLTTCASKPQSITVSTTESATSSLSMMTTADFPSTLTATSDTPGSSETMLVIAVEHAEHVIPPTESVTRKGPRRGKVRTCGKLPLLGEGGVDVSPLKHGNATGIASCSPPEPEIRDPPRLHKEHCSI